MTEHFEKVKEISEYVDVLLLDTKIGDKIGGTGKTHDWAIDLKIKDITDKPIMLSGGINIENIAKAVEKVKPNAIDVSSGVEKSPGIKDKDKVKKIIEVSSCL